MPCGIECNFMTVFILVLSIGGPILVTKIHQHESYKAWLKVRMTLPAHLPVIVDVNVESTYVGLNKEMAYRLSIKPGDMVVVTGQSSRKIAGYADIVECKMNALCLHPHSISRLLLSPGLNAWINTDSTMEECREVNLELQSTSSIDKFLNHLIENSGHSFSMIPVCRGESHIIEEKIGSLISVKVLSIDSNQCCVVTHSTKLVGPTNSLFGKILKLIEARKFTAPDLFLDVHPAPVL